MAGMKIRQIDPDERAALASPLQAYAFQATPLAPDAAQRMRDGQRYQEGNRTLVAEEDAAAMAVVSSIPMRQNLRGTVYPMAGIASVATHPLARLKGYVRALLTELLGRVRDEGQPVSALYPFRPSFYERFGYVGLPKNRTATFAPADLARLGRADLDGELAVERIGSGYPAYREFTQRLLASWHGFSVFPEYRAEQQRDADDHWLVTARVDGEMVAAAPYRITAHAEDLVADHLLATGVHGRALLLRFFARHVDQVRRIRVTVGADELPELWATDLATDVESRTTFPDAAPPMARVLALDALAGMAVGPGRVAVEVVDDPFVAGRYVLDGHSGHLEIQRGGDAAATLTVPALSGLVYGVLDPEDIVVRGLGTVPPDAAGELRILFPRRTPYLFSSF
jgi:predicted N-acetyltransferase YhbS